MVGYEHPFFIFFAACAAFHQNFYNSNGLPAAKALLVLGFWSWFGMSTDFLLQLTMDGAIISITVISISYFIFLTFFCICRRYCRTENLNGGSERRPRRANHGLDPAIIETFPTFAYSVIKGLKLGKEALECAVCLNEFQSDEKIRLLPKCDHVFHPDCIDAWLSKRTSCPVCRANLMPESSETNETTVSIQELEGESEGELGGSETEDAENQQVSVQVISEEEPPKEVTSTVATELINQMEDRPSGRFLRSHSTGHSVIQPGEDMERFTLRLPENVRKQIMNKNLNRTISMEMLQGVESSTPRYRSSEGSSRGGRFMKPEGWVFSMIPAFIMRKASPAWSPKNTPERDAMLTPPLSSPLAKPYWSPLRGEGSRNLKEPGGLRRASPASSSKMTAEGDETVTTPPTTPPAEPFWSPLRGEGARNLNEPGSLRRASPAWSPKMTAEGNRTVTPPPTPPAKPFGRRFETREHKI